MLQSHGCEFCLPIHLHSLVSTQLVSVSGVPHRLELIAVLATVLLACSVMSLGLRTAKGGQVY